jgi:putative FmdB family regulatory protein
MPLYEFKCGSCGRSFEDLVRRAEDEAEVACPSCGARKVTRLLSAPALGWLQAAGVSSDGGGCGGGGGGFT